MLFNDLLQNIIGGVTVGSTYGLIGLGVVFLWQSINRINFANISSAMLAAYLFYAFYTQLHFGFFLSFICSILIIAIYGILLRYLVYEPITRHGGDKLEFVVATLMLCILWLSVISATFGGLPKPFPPVFGEATSFVQLGPISIPSVYFWIFLVVLLLVLGLYFLLQKTFIGKMLRATAQNKEAAALMGVNVNLTTSIAFMMATTIVGIAGHFARAYIFRIPGTRGRIDRSERIRFRGDGRLDRSFRRDSRRDHDRFDREFFHAFHIVGLQGYHLLHDSRCRAALETARHF